jgi:hypothetical protein
MKNVLSVTATIATVLVSAPSIAHSGHDHGSSLALFEHLLWMAPLAVGIFAISSIIKKAKNNSTH